MKTDITLTDDDLTEFGKRQPITKITINDFKVLKHMVHEATTITYNSDKFNVVVVLKSFRPYRVN